jgi:hypothetical protein
MIDMQTTEDSVAFDGKTVSENRNALDRRSIFLYTSYVTGTENGYIGILSNGKMAAQKMASNG